LVAGAGMQGQTDQKDKTRTGFMNIVHFQLISISLENWLGKDKPIL
jgi:hypothetical protein